MSIFFLFSWKKKKTNFRIRWCAVEYIIRQYQSVYRLQRRTRSSSGDQQLKRRTKHNNKFVIKMKGKINWPNDTEMSIYVVLLCNIRDEMFKFKSKSFNLFVESLIYKKTKIIYEIIYLLLLLFFRERGGVYFFAKKKVAIQRLIFFSFFFFFLSFF